MRDLRKRFVSVLGSVLGAGALTACGGELDCLGDSDCDEDEAKVALREPFTESLCADGELSPITTLNPVEATDYVALRESQWDGVTLVLAEEGACATEAACSELALPAYEEGIIVNSFSGNTEHLALSRGDDVELLLSVNEVKAFLGSIDTPAEAALLAHFDRYRMDCTDNNLKTEEGGYLIYAEAGHTCGSDVLGYQLFVSADGSIEIRESAIVEKGEKNCSIGRLPAGLCGELKAQHSSPSEEASTTNSVGAYFAEIAYLEAAAVAAFEHLAAELEAHKAPLVLVEKARAAVREETRHAILMGALARRYGATRRIPTVQSRPVRSLMEIALDNAVEGLTRETFGALLGYHQALKASDPEVRRVMQLIAKDESGHAEFSWELHDWLCLSLTPQEQDEVNAARSSAIGRFRAASQESHDEQVREIAGLPSPEVSLRLYDTLFEGELGTDFMV